jgi:hypothetical protein
MSSSLNTCNFVQFGVFGLIFGVYSLFSILISFMEFSIIPFFVVWCFHDKINGVKVIALLLAIWAFLSYMYQHYLDDKRTKIDKSDGVKFSRGENELDDL